MILERHCFDFAMPDCRTSDLAALADQADRRVDSKFSSGITRARELPFHRTVERSIWSQKTFEVRRNGVLSGPLRAAADMLFPAPISNSSPRTMPGHTLRSLQIRHSFQPYGWQSLQLLIQRIYFYTDGFQRSHAQQRLRVGLRPHDDRPTDELAHELNFGQPW